MLPLFTLKIIAAGAAVNWFDRSANYNNTNNFRNVNNNGNANNNNASNSNGFVIYEKIYKNK